MEHAAHLVDLVDETGSVVGTKKRSEVNKQTDLCHTVYVFLCTPEHSLILGKPRQREDLPRLYPQKLGSTAATMRRHNETPDEASSRAAKHELGIDALQLTHVGESYLVLSDGHTDYASVYRGIHAVPRDFNPIDFENFSTFSRTALIAALETGKDAFTPTFLAIWQKYQAELLPT